MIILRINTHSGVPPYLQIVQQIKHDIRMGLLKKGDKLPTVKEAVTMTAVNPNTVFKAYRELENQGLVKGQPGIGIFVLKHPATPSVDAQAQLTAGLSRWIKEARKLDLDDESTEALFHITLRNSKRG
jgi:DNA-binding transcriptional regulator YhcF (GntR family)